MRRPPLVPVKYKFAYFVETPSAPVTVSDTIMSESAWGAVYSKAVSQGPAFMLTIVYPT